MQHGQRRLIAAIVAIFVTTGGIWLILFKTGAIPPPGKDAGLFKMSDRIADLQVVETPDGLRYQFGKSHLTPGEFAEQLKERRPEGSRGRVYSILNITGTAGFFWITLGLLGQVLFTGRMIIQWIASEKLKRSVIPNAFWWMSLGGATMLIIYFVWRVDIVGIIGQSTGWFIYMRNLWFIHSRPAEHRS